MIGRMSSDQIHQSGLDVILDAQARLARTQEELASGKRILNPSDDPVASAQIQNIKSELTRIETLQKNISHATSELAMVEDSVASIENILMRARELAVRGANDSLSAQDREIIATEIDGLREQLIAAATATYGDAATCCGDVTDYTVYLQSRDSCSLWLDSSQDGLVPHSNTEWWPDLSGNYPDGLASGPARECPYHPSQITI